MNPIPPSHSTVSLVSTTESVATATPNSSTAQLLPKPAQVGRGSTSVSTSKPVVTAPPSAKAAPTPAPRDYEKAFGALSTSYGFSQSFVAVPSKGAKAKQEKAKAKAKKDGRADGSSASTTASQAAPPSPKGSVPPPSFTGPR
ncbi:uncharacterized protein BXZ73DRAFT_101299 [Epithele typhae]|uniref:uncharacterized protein n=1 Tax=Epithele typhae TaxID=378194 RepID=UPI0020089EC9|nr:uncharacterized protein BXZ73DRAFT_101299 [Epithele typhae]KAH9932762.1 hypothetical protein BXZ73DRAFT_101299 [Epithele typhae]